MRKKINHIVLTTKVILFSGSTRTAHRADNFAKVSALCSVVY